MGTKKQEEKSKKLWIKVLAVGLCVVVAAMMVISAMGSSWISSLAVVKPGDVAVVDYTLNDAHGNPLVTTDAQVYKQALGSGSNILYSKQLTVTANQSAASSVYPVQVYSEGNRLVHPVRPVCERIRCDQQRDCRDEGKRPENDLP